MLALLLVVIVLVVTLFIFFVYRKYKVRKNGILFIGLSESGKTLTFSRLIFKKFINTQTSIKENISDYLSKNFVYKIIDAPGHERLRTRYFDDYKVLAKGIVFIIDSVTIHKDLQDVAEFLYSCLTDSYITINKPPILVLCNKQEEATAKSCAVIKIMLENELNILRFSRSNQLESIGKTANNIFLGREDKDFEFSHLHPLKVEFAECSALSKDAEEDFNLEELENWIENLE